LGKKTTGCVRLAGGNQEGSRFFGPKMVLHKKGDTLTTPHIKMLACFRSEMHAYQSDQIWRIFAHWVIVNFGFFHF
jgi:hypothetical protein